MIGFTNYEVVNTISILHAFYICFRTFTLALFSQFFLLFLGNRSILFHDVGFLDAAVELDSIITLCFSAGAGFNVFMWPLCGVLFRIFF